MGRGAAVARKQAVNHSLIVTLHPLRSQTNPQSCCDRRPFLVSKRTVGDVRCRNSGRRLSQPDQGRASSFAQQAAQRGIQTFETRSAMAGHANQCKIKLLPENGAWWAQRVLTRREKWRLLKRRALKRMDCHSKCTLRQRTRSINK